MLISLSLLCLALSVWNMSYAAVGLAVQRVEQERRCCSSPVSFVILVSFELLRRRSVDIVCGSYRSARPSSELVRFFTPTLSVWWYFVLSPLATFRTFITHSVAHILSC